MIYPAIKLSKSLITLENGSRPLGGVGQIRNGIPSLGGEHISTDGKCNFYLISKICTRTLFSIECLVELFGNKKMVCIC